MCRRVKDLREDFDFSQEYLAKYLSCSQSAYSKIENGKRQLSNNNLNKLTKQKHVKTEYILFLTDYPYRLHNKK